MPQPTDKKLIEDFEILSRVLYSPNNAEATNAALAQSGFETLDALAQSRGYKNFISMALDAGVGANPNTQDADGRTALDIAVATPSGAALLIKNGAPPNSTALQFAAAQKPKPFADPNQVVKGQTPFQAATQTPPKA